MTSVRTAGSGGLCLSYRTGQPVVTMIAQRVVPSLILTGTGVAFAILIGIPLGVMAPLGLDPARSVHRGYSAGPAVGWGKGYEKP